MSDSDDTLDEQDDDLNCSSPSILTGVYLANFKTTLRFEDDSQDVNTSRAKRPIDLPEDENIPNTRCVSPEYYPPFSKVQKMEKNPGDLGLYVASSCSLPSTQDEFSQVSGYEVAGENDDISAAHQRVVDIERQAGILERLKSKGIPVKASKEFTDLKEKLIQVRMLLSSLTLSQDIDILNASHQDVCSLSSKQKRLLDLFKRCKDVVTKIQSLKSGKVLRNAELGCSQVMSKLPGLYSLHGLDIQTENTLTKLSFDSERSPHEKDTFEMQIDGGCGEDNGDRDDNGYGNYSDDDDCNDDNGGGGGSGCDDDDGGGGGGNDDGGGGCDDDGSVCDDGDGDDDDGGDDEDKNDADDDVNNDVDDSIGDSQEILFAHNKPTASVPNEDVYFSQDTSDLMLLSTQDFGAPMDDVDTGSASNNEPASNVSNSNANTNNTAIDEVLLGTQDYKTSENCEDKKEDDNDGKPEVYLASHDKPTPRGYDIPKQDLPNDSFNRSKHITSNSSQKMTPTVSVWNIPSTENSHSSILDVTKQPTPTTAVSCNASCLPAKPSTCVQVCSGAITGTGSTTNVQLCDNVIPVTSTMNSHMNTIPLSTKVYYIADNVPLATKALDAQAYTLAGTPSLPGTAPTPIYTQKSTFLPATTLTMTGTKAKSILLSTTANAQSTVSLPGTAPTPIYLQKSTFQPATTMTVTGSKANDQAMSILLSTTATNTQSTVSLPGTSSTVSSSHMLSQAKTTANITLSTTGSTVTNQHVPTQVRTTSLPSTISHLQDPSSGISLDNSLQKSTSMTQMCNTASIVPSKEIYATTSMQKGVQTCPSSLPTSLSATNVLPHGGIARVPSISSQVNNVVGTITPYSKVTSIPRTNTSTPVPVPSISSQVNSVARTVTPYPKVNSIPRTNTSTHVRLVPPISSHVNSAARTISSLPGAQPTHSLQKNATAKTVSLYTTVITTSCQTNNGRPSLGQLKKPDSSTQPVIPSRPQVVDIITLLRRKVISPGIGVLSVKTQGRKFEASLKPNGSIQSTGGEVFYTPMAWLKAVTGSKTTSRQPVAYSKIFYKDRALSSFTIPEAIQKDDKKQPAIIHSAAEVTQVPQNTNNSNKSDNGSCSDSSYSHRSNSSSNNNDLTVFDLSKLLNANCKLHLISDNELIPTASILPADFWSRDFDIADIDPQLLDF